MLEEVFPDASDVLARAAAIVTDMRPASIAVASAGVLRGMLSALAGSLANSGVWPADDRCVPPTSPDSAGAFLSAAVPGARVHRIRGEDPPAEAARIYDEEIRANLGEEPILDLVILAAGGDGRVAGLFPDGDELRERVRAAVVGGLDHHGPRRVTLTLPVLNRARRTLIVATGADKAPMVARVRDGVLLPAARVLGAEWLMDEAAATAPVRPVRRRPGEPLEGQEVLFEL